jgi:hypothetical protein
VATQEDSCGNVLPLRPATSYGGALPGMRHPGQFETTWSRRAVKSMWPLRQIGARPSDMLEGFLTDFEGPRAVMEVRRCRQILRDFPATRGDVVEIDIGCIQPLRHRKTKAIRSPAT